jgi:hypothetical protein
MVITLYRNNSERNCVNKVLTNERILNGSLRGETSIKTPVINIAGDENTVFYNYAFIDEFNRYYFITDIKSIRTGIWEISFLCDVLMSFKSDILNSYAVIDHTMEHDISNYLSSDIWTTLVKDKTDIINFSGSSLLDSGEYILITAGG